MKDRATSGNSIWRTAISFCYRDGVDVFELNIRHLRATTVIAAKRSMSAAADAVSLSQPALTQGIAKMERQLSVLLYERRNDGVIPTDAGLKLAARVETALSHLSAAARAITRGRRSAHPEQSMTSSQLRAFLALADAGSFTRAADALALSRPAVIRVVRELEHICATSLAERRGRGVSLNTAGRRLARGIRLAYVEIAAALIEIRAPEETSVRIAVGAMPLSRAILLPRAITTLVSQRPTATVDVVEGSWRELVELLRDGVIDLMIGALRTESLPELQQTPLLVEPLIVVGGAHHPLATVKHPRIDQLTSYPWIVGRSGAPLRERWEKMFGAFSPRAPVECGSVMTIREILRHSDFLTLLSPDQVSVELEANVLKAIGGPLSATERTIGLVTRAGWRPTEVHSTFIDALARIADEQSGK